MSTEPRPEFIRHADVDAIEAELRKVLPANDPLHPDNYDGPWGMLWSQAAIWVIEAARAPQR